MVKFFQSQGILRKKSSSRIKFSILNTCQNFELEKAE